MQQAKENGEVEARGEAATSAASNFSTSDIGQRVARPRILEDERYRPDLLRLVQGARKISPDDPAARFADALPKLRYYIWDVPERVLLRSERPDHTDHSADGAAAAGNDQVDEARPRALKLAILIDEFGGVREADWNREGIEKVMEAIGANEAWRECSPAENVRGPMYEVLRWALLGGDKGLPIGITMEILGREETLRRLRFAELANRKVALPLSEPGR